LAATPVHPYPGIQVHENRNGQTVVRLHYECDPEKMAGPKTFVPEINRHLNPLRLKQFQGTLSVKMWMQEEEIDFSAAQGERVYHFDEAATLVDSSQMPDEGTDYFALDPHERRPFAALWARVDRWENIWLYREFWPSKVCFRYENGILRGEPGNLPEDDSRHSIKEFVEAVQWLESAENPQNSGRDRYPEKRVIDYAARAQGQGSMDDPDQPNFQQRIQAKANDLALDKNLDFDMRFEDAKKDWGVGVETMNELLKPIPVRDAVEDKWIHRSKLRICQDRCPETIYELKNNRWKQLTAQQAEVMDPTGKPIPKRNNLSDCARYLAMANLVFVKPMKPARPVSPVYAGIGY
jgi:hypothetical protein